jgi:hypothetical protein
MDRREFVFSLTSMSALLGKVARDRKALIPVGISREAAMQIFSEHYERRFETSELADFSCARSSQ